MFLIEMSSRRMFAGLHFMSRCSPSGISCVTLMQTRGRVLSPFPVVIFERLDVMHRFAIVSALIVTATLLSSNVACAQLIAYEGFAYKPSQSLLGRDGGVGWKGAWFGPPTATGVTIGEPSLTHPKLAIGGGKCLQDGKDTRLFRFLDTTRDEVALLVDQTAVGKTFGKNGTTIWITFLICCTSYPKLAHGGMHLMDGVELGANYKRTQRIQLGRQNQGTHWLLVRTDQGGPAAGRWDGTVTSDQTTRLLAYRFDFKEGPEEGWMWVDPVPGKDPSVDNADLHAPKIADFRFNAVNIGSGGGVNFHFDELRIGSTFLDVAPLEGARP